MVGNSQTVVKQITLGKYQKIWTVGSIPDLEVNSGPFLVQLRSSFSFSEPLLLHNLTNYEQAGGQAEVWPTLSTTWWEGRHQKRVLWRWEEFVTFGSKSPFLNTSDWCQIYLKSKIKLYALLFANDIRKRNFWNVNSRYTSICNHPPPISSKQIFAFEVEYILIRDPESVASPREEWEEEEEVPGGEELTACTLLLSEWSRRASGGWPAWAACSRTCSRACPRACSRRCCSWNCCKDGGHAALPKIIDSRRIHKFSKDGLEKWYPEATSSG